MKTIGLGNFIPKFPQQNSTKNIDPNSKFDGLLSNFIKGVNVDQLDSKQITTDFIEGKDVEIHEVMIAGEKAKTSLDLLMQIRNKTVDMYKELTRMQ
ncbi:MAG: flagellar hook-basal body complex protein FliE [Ignavibacteriae bacterium]|nr:flagellar hook-basal body complex protein FliE [Ignavibacteriota bacterium]